MRLLGTPSGTCRRSFRSSNHSKSIATGHKTDISRALSSLRELRTLRMHIDILTDSPHKLQSVNDRDNQMATIERHARVFVNNIQSVHMVGILARNFSNNQWASWRVTRDDKTQAELVAVESWDKKKEYSDFPL
ncbi:hypothetical protein OF83DRAFT_835016 [Amylostereum chailletii]|nr:hypothetical protein OF83DRAFT_835016 [Amylostereum chailletii]